MAYFLSVFLYLESENYYGILNKTFRIYYSYKLINYFSIKKMDTVLTVFKGGLYFV